ALPGLPPLAALWEQRSSYLASLGDAAGSAVARARAKALPPTCASDCYWLAATPLNQGRRDEAVAPPPRALQFNAKHYWSRMQLGICRADQGELILAAADFGVCIGLWPEFPLGYVNRGRVLDQSGKRADALADYSAALDRDPGFGPAYLNRGLAHHNEKRYAAALADFESAA